MSTDATPQPTPTSHMPVTFDGQQLALSSLLMPRGREDWTPAAEHAAALLPDTAAAVAQVVERLARRADWPGHPDAVRLALVMRLSEHLHDLVFEEIDLARSHGATWGQVAEALGLEVPAIQERDRRWRKRKQRAN